MIYAGHTTTTSSRFSCRRRRRCRCCMPAPFLPSLSLAGAVSSKTRSMCLISDASHASIAVACAVVACLCGGDNIECSFSRLIGIFLAKSHAQSSAKDLLRLYAMNRVSHGSVKLVSSKGVSLSMLRSAADTELVYTTRRTVPAAAAANSDEGDSG